MSVQVLLSPREAALFHSERRGVPDRREIREAVQAGIAEVKREGLPIGLFARKTRDAGALRRSAEEARP